MRDLILSELSRLFRSQVGQELNAEALLFVDDDSVEYSGINLRVPRAALVTISYLDSFVQMYTEGGPDWIHFQQCLLPDHRVLVTIRRGALIGARQSSINTSFTRNYRVDFV